MKKIIAFGCIAIGIVLLLLSASEYKEIYSNDDVTHSIRYDGDYIRSDINWALYHEITVNECNCSKVPGFVSYLELAEGVQK